MILWDFSIQTEHEIEYNKPDIVVHDTTKRECTVIDVACLFDIRMDKKEVAKIEKYHDLKRELMMIWKCRRKYILFLLSLEPLGTLSRNFKFWASKIEMYDHVDLMQKACVLGIAKIIRKVLDIKGNGFGLMSELYDPPT